MRTMIRYFVLTAALLFAAAPAYALRCGSALINEGSHISKAYRYCGEPDFSAERLKVATRPVVFHERRRLGSYTRVRSEHRHHSYSVTEEIVITELTYNFGPNRLMRMLRYENGRLTDIETLGYGYWRRSKD